MRYSKFFGKTLRDKPHDVTSKSHELLLRAGFITAVAAGIYDFLPLGFKVLEKIDRIIKEELSKKGVQHLLMPFVHPASLWKETGRFTKMKRPSLAETALDWIGSVQDYFLTNSEHIQCAKRAMASTIGSKVMWSCMSPCVGNTGCRR